MINEWFQELKKYTLASILMIAETLTCVQTFRCYYTKCVENEEVPRSES